jgi:hypothetical protein
LSDSGVYTLYMIFSIYNNGGTMLIPTCRLVKVAWFSFQASITW